MITIINYGLGNLASIKNIIKKVGGEAEITDDIDKINAAKKIIIPGVGSFAQGMANLKEKNLIPLLNKKALEEKVPVLGICLGMQLMTTHSEEGNVDGLNWIPAQTNKFAFENKNLKVPHMSWTEIIRTKPNHPIFSGLDVDCRFYFVHSYYVTCNNPENILSESNYGINFNSGIVKENIMGFQFHPEKSHRYGMTIMKNFINNF